MKLRHLLPRRLRLDGIQGRSLLLGALLGAATIITLHATGSRDRKYVTYDVMDTVEGERNNVEVFSDYHIKRKLFNEVSERISRRSLRNGGGEVSFSENQRLNLVEFRAKSDFENRKFETERNEGVEKDLDANEVDVTSEDDVTVSSVVVNETSQKEHDVTSQLKTSHFTAYDVRTPGRARRFPHALIFGVKKCGTESLAHFLTVHPHIKYTQREIHFFDHTKLYRKGVNWYRKNMPLTLPGQITIEKTPNYFDKDVSPLRVRMFNSSIRLIMIVRDPTRRLVSDYTHNTKHPGTYGRREAFHSFSDMVFLRNGSVNRDYFPVLRGVYHRHYSRWLDYFPREQILVLDGEVFMRDPYPALKQVESFLGLESYITREHFVYSKKKKFFCKRIGGKPRCMPGNKGRKHPNVDEEKLETIREFYRPHNAIFEEMLNYKFSWP